MDIFCRDVKPYPPLDIQQVQFWLRIMKEHSLFIKLGLSCSETRLIEEAEQFYSIFEDLEQRARYINCEQDYLCFIDEVIVAVKRIFAFKRHLLHLLIECKIGGSNYPLLIDHVSREAMYFLKILQKIKDGDMKYPVDSIVSENVFWLRIMADHIKFIRGLLDPSERGFFDQSNQFSQSFDQLGLQARDLDSMLWHFQPTNALARFEKDVVTETIKLRNFKEAARNLIQQCAVQSLIPPLLADHVLREAEHFLEILCLIEGDLREIPNKIVTC